VDLILGLEAGLMPPKFLMSKCAPARRVSALPAAIKAPAPSARPGQNGFLLRRDV
jgi:hypothetical protein